ncbi:hypothetical protein EIP86_001136 [Pleurotus ostreatoroseus]|nr:hypothetical protein EIP86_001136 [Pleurotus ostreatoroseus]
MRLTGGNKAESFTTFLCESPHIRPLVKNLILKGQNRAFYGDIGWLHISVQALADMVVSLPQLTSLTLELVQFLSTEEAAVSCSSPIHLDTLVMRRTSAGSDLDDPYDPRPAFELLSLFSNIDVLSVDKISSIGDHIDDFTTKEQIEENMVALKDSLVLKVRSLRLRRLSQLPPLFWLEYLQNAPSQGMLTDLSVHADIVDDITSFGSLIRKSGGTLTTVELDFTKCSVPGVVDSIPEHIDLTVCKHLQSVHVAIGATPMRTFPKLLRDLPTTLRHITLEFEVSPNLTSWEKSFAELDWQSMESSWLALPSLASVTFVLQREPKVGFSSVQKRVIQGRLPGLDQRGLLNFGLEGFHSNDEDEEDEDTEDED